jgi:hypothetical protein
MLEDIIEKIMKFSKQIEYHDVMMWKFVKTKTLCS